MDNLDNVENDWIVSPVCPFNEGDPRPATAQAEEEINLASDNTLLSDIYSALMITIDNANSYDEIQTTTQTEEAEVNSDVTGFIASNHNPNEQQQSTEQVIRPTEAIPTNSVEPSSLMNNLPMNDLPSFNYANVNTTIAQMITHTSNDISTTNPYMQPTSESVITFQSQLKMYFWDPRTLQRLYEFLLADYRSHLLASGNMNGEKGVSHANQDCCDEFLEEFRKAFINSDQILYIGPTMEPEYIAHAALDVTKQGTSADISDYNILNPILKTVPEVLSYPGSLKKKDKEKIILNFGKQCFDILFDVNKQDNANDEDDDKTCLIARFLSWIFTDPKEVTIEKFAEYAKDLVRKMEHGMSEIDYNYFKRNILHRYKSKKKINTTPGRGS